MTKKLSSVRVIAGEFKSRKIIFPHNLMIRPTGDRIRESLFSWLQTEIAGANCLDLFAGSGALGIEALSRGAKKATFVEINKKAALALNENLKSFGTRNVNQISSRHRYMSSDPCSLGSNRTFGNLDQDRISFFQEFINRLFFLP